MTSMSTHRDDTYMLTMLSQTENNTTSEDDTMPEFNTAQTTEQPTDLTSMLQQYVVSNSKCLSN